MPRNWANGTAPYLSAENLNAMESDITTALGVPDAALNARVTDPGSATNASLKATFVRSNPVVASVVLDTNGNRTSWTEDGVACSATYDVNENMQTLTVGGVTRTFTYDSNGNMIGAA